MRKQILILLMMMLVLAGSVVRAQGVGGGGATVPIIPIILTENETNYDLHSSRLIFEFKNKLYAIQLYEVGPRRDITNSSDYARFLVMTYNETEQDLVVGFKTEQDFYLLPNESKEIDINNDSLKEVILKLNNLNISVRHANFSLTKIIPSVVQNQSNQTNETEVQENQTKPRISSELKFNGSGWAPVVILVNSEEVIDNVIASLPSTNFIFTKKMAGNEGFIGEISQKGLDILANNSNVKAVESNAPIHMIETPEKDSYPTLINNTENITQNQTEIESQDITTPKSFFQIIINFFKSLFGLKH